MFYKLKIFPIIPLVFILCALYWLYLAYVSQMIIANDAAGYEDLGRVIFQKGWIEFFKTGPNREPIYPWLVSISMHLANIFALSYQDIQKLIHIGIMAVSQILLFILLQKLHIRKPLTAATLLYFGFSPAVVNSILCLYYEIATYPFILATILLSGECWQMIGKKESRRRLFLLAFLLGLCLVMLIFIKGIFELIVPLYLAPFFIYALKSFINKKKETFHQTIIFLLIILTTFYIPTTIYKLINKTYTGFFTITDRGPWALYGNAAWRVEKLTTNKFLQVLTYVPGDRVCRALLGPDACHFGSPEPSDEYGHNKWNELFRNKLPPDQASQTIIKLAILKALENPFQYAMLTFLQGLKLFFWEWTKLGYATYPDWLEQLYNLPLLENGLSYLMNVLSFLGFLYLARVLWNHRKKIFACPVTCDESIYLLLSIFTLIVSFIFAYSFFFIIIRYALPIAPLYLTTIAFYFQKKYFKSLDITKQ